MNLRLPDTDTIEDDVCAGVILTAIVFVYAVSLMTLPLWLPFWVIGRLHRKFTA